MALPRNKARLQKQQQKGLHSNKSLPGRFENESKTLGYAFENVNVCNKWQKNAKTLVLSFKLFHVPLCMTL